SEELAKHLRRRREERHSLEVGRRIDLHRTHEEGQPGSEQNRDDATLADTAEQRGPCNHPPATPVLFPPASVPSIALVVNRAHTSPTARANTSSSVGTLARRCRT